MKPNRMATTAMAPTAMPALAPVLRPALLDASDDNEAVAAAALTLANAEGIAIDEAALVVVAELEAGLLELLLILNTVAAAALGEKVVDVDGLLVIQKISPSK